MKYFHWDINIEIDIGNRNYNFQNISADDMFYLLFKDNRDEFVKNVALKGVRYNLIYKIRDVSAKILGGCTKIWVVVPKFGWLCKNCGWLC